MKNYSKIFFLLLFFPFLSNAELYKSLKKNTEFGYIESKIIDINNENIKLNIKFKVNNFWRIYSNNNPKCGISISFQHALIKHEKNYFSQDILLSDPIFEKTFFYNKDFEIISYIYLKKPENYLYFTVNYVACKDKCTPGQTSFKIPLK